MPPGHLDRLSALDASFLHQEGPDSHMHIGALALCEGPPPTLEELAAHIGGLLHLVPRYRQRLAHTALDRGRPLWADDPHFRVEYHLRHTALPAPAGRRELLELLARIFSEALDRDRPLWELWLVEGLEHDHFALIFKSHHAMIDGIGGVDLATVVLDLDAASDVARDGAPPWRPAPVPGTVELLAVGACELARGSLTLARGALGAALRPRRALAHGRAALEGLGEVLWELLDAAPQT